MPRYPIHVVAFVLSESYYVDAFLPSSSPMAYTSFMLGGTVALGIMTRMPTFFKSIKKLNKAGTKIKVKIVEVTRPPNTMLPMPRYNSEPAPDATENVVCHLDQRVEGDQQGADVYGQAQASDRCWC